MRLDRLNKMEQYIFNCGNVSLEDLAREFNISISTVRRDVSEIMRHKTIQKVYGGVSAVQPGGSRKKPDQQGPNADTKQTIGYLAAEAIRDGDTVYIDTGATACAVVPFLADKKNVTILTNSLTVIQEVVKYPNLGLFSLGGFYNKSINGFVGISVTDCLNRLSFNVAILGTSGIADSHELTIDGFFEEPIKRQVLAKSGKKLILVVDSSKFGKSSLFSFGTLSDVQYLVTDQEPSAAYLETNTGVTMIYPESEARFA